MAPNSGSYLPGGLVHLAGVALTQLNDHVQLQLHLGEEHLHLCNRTTCLSAQQSSLAFFSRPFLFLLFLHLKGSAGGRGLGWQPLHLYCSFSITSSFLLYKNGKGTQFLVSSLLYKVRVTHKHTCTYMQKSFWSKVDVSLHKHTRHALSSVWQYLSLTAGSLWYSHNGWLGIKPQVAYWPAGLLSAPCRTWITCFRLVWRFCNKKVQWGSGRRH